MTIAISIKINDGLVLATDSASTLIGQFPDGQLHVLNVYNHANKLFNLRKGFPIGAITWGTGSIGQASISTIIKDLRQRFSSNDPQHKDWTLNKDGYTVEEVAKKLKEFVYDDLYKKAFPQQKPSLGFIVAGFSANQPMAEEFQIDIQNGECTGPRRLRNQEDCGVTWAGEPEALNRFIMGYSPMITTLLQQQLGIDPAQMNQAMSVVQAQVQLPVVLPAMPLQDAIDVARFMVELTVKFSRYRPGAPTVGGPIEIAAISKHEGFRWVERKYYFDRKLNPDEVYERVYEPTHKGAAKE
ncbi:MAG TPA: hypothetical protein VFI45_01965 [Candidatus Acidoferrum sp.]|nr:hypothetical protein [Candidatus Acidoferrum sp.]